MFRRLVGPAIVIGLSLLATTAMADNSDDSDPDEQAQVETEKKPPYIPDLFMTLKGDVDGSNDVADPEAEFVVTEGLLDKTVALSEDVEGLPNVGINFWNQDSDMKFAGSLDSSGFAMDYKLEGGSFSFHTEGVGVQTPVDAATAMNFVQDMANVGLQHLP